jgi:hypothetical protein
MVHTKMGSEEAKISQPTATPSAVGKQWLGVGSYRGTVLCNTYTGKCNGHNSHLAHSDKRCQTCCSISKRMQANAEIRGR